VSLEFKFKGEFFSLADFFHRLKRFVYVEGDKVRVRGRLMTIDGVEYATEAESFPLLTATVKSTVYLSPKTEGVTAGAPPAGPQAASVAPVPTTTASGGSSSPTPTAAATP
jgi:pyruvate/2-oxoglutarate dehydrogenase complex dihydrolipoamide acyltransferase (E2) component